MLAKLRSGLALKSRVRNLFKPKKRPGSGLPARPVIRKLVWARRAAQLGSAFGGLFDPICIAVRAIGLGVLPAAQYLAGGANHAIAGSNLRPLQAAGDHAADFLAGTVWQSKQFYYHQSWLIGVTLVA